MGLDTCIADLEAKGTIDRERADRYRALYAERVAAYAKHMAQPAAIARATGETVDAVEAEMFQKKRQTLLQIAAQRDRMKNIADNIAAGGTAAQAAVAFYDLELHTRGIPNLDALKRAINGQTHAQIQEVLHTFDQDILGRVRNPATQESMVHELFGEATGDTSAAELGQSWTATNEWLRQRFNAAGGHIGKLENWGLPQSHDSLKVRNVPFEEWRDFIAPRLDPSKMRDSVTGQPFTHWS